MDIDDAHTPVEAAKTQQAKANRKPYTTQAVCLDFQTPHWQLNTTRRLTARADNNQHNITYPNIQILTIQ